MTKPFSIQQLEDIAGKAREAGKQAEFVDVQVRKLANQLKCISLTMVTASRVYGTGDGEGMSDLMTKMLTKSSQDTSKLLQALDIPPEQAPEWLGNQVRGILLDVVASGVSLNIGSAARMDSTAYMQPIIEHVQQNQGFEPVDFDSPDVGYEPRMGLALAMATSSVMAAYESYTYYHPEAKPVAEMVTNYLHDRVYTETLSELKDTYHLNNAEAAYIGNTLMRHAGDLLANSWAKCVPEVHDAVKQMQPSERKSVMAKGFPLDLVFQDFDNFYEGMKLSVMTAFSQTMTERVQPIQKKSNGPSLG